MKTIIQSVVITKTILFFNAPFFAQAKLDVTWTRVLIFLRFVFFIGLLIPISLSYSDAQSCLPSGITFTSQSEIDNFSINYPGCTEIEGDVSISYTTITNVDGLSSVTSMGGSLYIGGNTNLTNVDGLSHVTSIAGFFYIENNANLTNVDGLSNVVSVGGNLSIQYNANLTNCCGIKPLLATPGAIAGAIYISSNPSECSNEAEILATCGPSSTQRPATAWDAISVYPDPVTDVFQLEVPMELIGAGMMVDLVDITNTSHFSERIKNTISIIPVYNLPPGLYFLRIVYDERMVQVKKLLVEK